VTGNPGRPAARSNMVKPPAARGKAAMQPRKGNNMKIRGTDFIMYLVTDLARAAKFYREALGLPQEIYSDEWQWAEFNCGNITLALRGGSKLPKVMGGGRIALAVDDIHAAHEELAQKGVHISSKPVDNSVCWSMEILDPDGNLVILHRRTDGTFGSRA
jgi:predicted enzyme related to lactoylglutathione lyase